jgi:hypothetical protein
MAATGLRFGLEGEYLLVEADTFRPLWHPEVTFQTLNALLEGIPFEPLLHGLSLDGLELDAPHRKLMPYYVEGYGLADAGLTTFVDKLPKGIEVRTPVCPSIDVCLQIYENLYHQLQLALAAAGLRAVACAHHPTASGFQGPQNHQRVDWWRWDQESMTTYGPDLNVGLPEARRAAFNWPRLQRRVNYYAPAITAFSLAAPFGQGRLWQPRGRQGLSLRTYQRSVFGPAVAYHPKEQGRLEFKALDMPADRRDFFSYFLLWTWLILDPKAVGEANEQDRVYDLGALARMGWEAEEVVARAEEALDLATEFLPAIDLDPAPLRALRRRLETRTTPAQALIRQMQANSSVPGLLRLLDSLGEQRAAAHDAFTMGRPP